MYIKLFGFAFIKKQKRVNSSCCSFKKSDWSKLLFTKRAIHSLKKSERVVHYFLSKTERFARITKEQIPNPVDWFAICMYKLQQINKNKLTVSVAVSEIQQNRPPKD